ncbi:class I SAM-dependent methyltransferase [Lactiplantibacillus herbarum]|uniref:class I SAM-dependent methyltransferase n=1 Tax=Lactiplantibacillus herbarum TaxID=1670446 RepID=UPI00064FBBB5|nr:class I SAM-dependent methyltransferase [Lactiplantibacillus herbarum]
MNQVINPGDYVIDATVGNGHDTVYLAKLVGPNGHVDGFASQPAAITVTRDILAADHLTKQVTLWQTGYDQIDTSVAADQPIKCAVFNLSNQLDDDEKLVTKPSTTLAAIQAVKNRLTTNGLIIILTDADTAQTIHNYTKNLDQHQYQVLQYQFVNQAQVSPCLLAIQKR